MDGRKSPARRPVTTRHNRLAGSGPVAVPGSDEGPPASRAGVRIPSFMTQRRRGMNGQWPLQDFLELGALVSAVPCARLHARQVLWEWGVLGSLGESTELLVAELVTNAVKASRAATKASCPARKQDWAGDLQAFLRQAARVFVDQSAQDRFSADLLCADGGHRGAGSVTFVGDALVRPGRVVMHLVFGQDGAQMPLAEDQHPVEKFSAQGARRSRSCAAPGPPRATSEREAASSATVNEFWHGTGPFTQLRQILGHRLLTPRRRPTAGCRANRARRPGHPPHRRGAALRPTPGAAR